MAESRLKVILETSGTGQIKTAMRQTKQLEKEVKDLNGQLKKTSVSSVQAAKGIRGVGTASKNASRSVGLLSKAFAKITIAIAAIKGLTGIFTSTAELETQTRSIQILTGSLEETKKIITELQDFGSVTPFTSPELIETAKRLKAFGVETKKLVATTKRLADVSGATGARLQEVATAYGQIQAKGRLQGEELLQLQERGIALQGELQRMYGLTGEEFTKALSKGKFSAEAVEQAIVNLTKKGGKYADGAIAQSTTLAGKFSTLVDRVVRLAQIIGDALKPAIDFVLTAAINATNQIIRLINFANQLLGIGSENRIANLKKEISDLESGARIRGFEGREARIKRLKEELKGLEGQLKKTVDTGEQLEIVIENIPDLRGDTTPDTEKIKIGDTVGSLKPKLDFTEANELDQLLKDQAESYSQIREQLTRTLEIGKKTSNAQKELLRLEYETFDLKRRIEREVGAANQQELKDLVDKIKLQKELKILERRNASIVDSFTNTFKEGQEIDDAIKGPFEDLAEQTIPMVGQAIRDSIVTALDAAIRGTEDLGKSLQQIASDLLISLGGMFLDAGFAGLGKSLKLPGYAEGGYVTGPTPALIGEGGEPEYVIPQSRMSSALAKYAAGARGESVIEEGGAYGSSSSSTALMEAPTQINISGGVMQIDNQNYIRQDQIPSIMQQASEMGEIRALKRIQQNPSTRRRLGL